MHNTFLLVNLFFSLFHVKNYVFVVINTLDFDRSIVLVVTGSHNTGTKLSIFFSPTSPFCKSV